jgi:glycosyltransferase involved in cell wall biosynthesis
MMRHAVIVSDHAYVNGGQAKVAIDTALALKANGLDVSFFSGVGPVDPRLPAAGITSICLEQHDLLGDPQRARSAVRGLWNRAAATTLKAHLREIDPASSIVHIHGWAKSLSPSIGPVITNSNVPHVYTLHEYFLACPNGGFYDHHQRQICTRAPMGASCLSANCDPRSRLHKAWRVARHAVLQSAGAMPRALRDLIYLTETQLSAVRPYLSPRSRLHHLPNPLKKSDDGRVEAEKNGIYLFMGRLSPEKGAELAARAARQAGVKIAFAGEGECSRQVAEANPDALMLGWLKPAELSAWISKARCLVFPSLWYECLPLSVIEAMQRGLPVLVSDRCAAAELVRDGVDGVHVRTGELNAWVRAMDQMQDPQLVESLSRSSFETAKGFLDPESYAARLMAIYEKVAESQSAERTQKVARAS